MNYYQHHIGDYRRDTAHLSLLEHGVYRQLLDWYYLSEESIPEETNLVIRRLCARTDEEKNAVITVLKEFFSLENGWIQPRCEREIAAYKAKADRARENGKLGGRRPRTKVVISGNPELTQEKTNHKPLTINHKPLESTGEAHSRKIKMHIDWKPEQEMLKAICQRTGVTTGIISQGALAEFTTYWADEPGYFTEAQWIQKLINSARIYQSKNPIVPIPEKPDPNKPSALALKIHRELHPEQYANEAQS